MSQSNVSALLGVDDQPRSSRQPSIEPRRDNSRMMQVAMSERTLSGREYGAGAAGDSQKVDPEERLARNRIKHLHDVFVSAHGGEGLNIDEFRSAMRPVFSEEYGRKVEDYELDKVPVVYRVFQKNRTPWLILTITSVNMDRF